MNRRHGRRPTFTWRGWLLVWLLPVALVAGLVGVHVALRPAPPASASAGDPYFPDAGAAGYDALAYDIWVRWDADARELVGRTAVRARAASDLDDLHVDLALRVTSARVDGVAAKVREGHGTDRGVLLPTRIPAGREFTLEVEYAGDPTSYETMGERAALIGGGELAILGEPSSAPAWFPSNDHPSDPALIEVRATVPAGVEAISTGALVSADADDDPATATWHWKASQPMATYLTFLAVGQFTVEQGVAQGRPAVYAVSERLPQPARAVAMENLRRTPDVIAQLEKDTGPYPFTEIGGVVVSLDTWFTALECQTRPVYDATLGRSERDGTFLLTHELAHQWFGNNVRIVGWRDIVNNEGFATFAGYRQREASEPGYPNRVLKRGWDGYDAGFWRPSISDPGHGNLFNTVYPRGGMALQALRNILGDAVFFRLYREWAQTAGNRSLDDWRRFVERGSGRDLSAFFAAWYDAPEAPPKTAAFGYPA